MKISNNKPLTLRQAINAKCKECIYDPYPGGCGTWREQVE
jgi:hypothetical protein